MLQTLTVTLNYAGIGETSIVQKFDCGSFGVVKRNEKGYEINEYQL